MEPEIKYQIKYMSEEEIMIYLILQSSYNEKTNLI